MHSAAVRACKRNIRGANLLTANEYMVVEGNGKIAGLADVERSYVDFP